MTCPAQEVDLGGRVQSARDERESATDIVVVGHRRAIQLFADADSVDRSSVSSIHAFVYAEPQPGSVFLWESWLRHEVVANAAKGERISVSFNYR